MINKNYSDELYNNTIRQLKSINVILLTVSSVMAVFIFLSKKTEIEVAIDDLKNLQSAFVAGPGEMAKPVYGDAWLEEEEEKIIKNENIEFPGSFFRDGEKIRIINSEKKYIPEGPDYTKQMMFQEQLYPKGFMSLEKLKELWDGISRIRKIVYLDRISDYVAEYDSEKGKFVYKDGHILREGPEIFSRTGRLSLVKVDGDKWIKKYFPEYKDNQDVKDLLVQMAHKPNVSSPYYLFGKKTEMTGFDFRSPGTFGVSGDNWKDYEYSQVSNAFSGKIFIPVSTREVAFNPQKILIDNSPDDFGWKPGGFSLNFSELDEFTDGYQDIPIDKVSVILEKELERGLGSVNAFGLSIPFHVVSKLGVFAILAVQLYFFLYLRFLRKNFASDVGYKLEVPWVFMHEGLPSVVLFYLVSVVYPASIAVYFSWINVLSSSEQWGSVGYLIAGLSEVFVVTVITHQVFSFRHAKDIFIRAI